jgi:hypothetical protein
MTAEEPSLKTNLSVSTPSAFAIDTSTKADKAASRKLFSFIAPYPFLRGMAPVRRWKPDSDLLEA